MIYPVPKPTRSHKPKTRMKQRNAKRQGSSFPGMRDPQFCRFVVEETPCVGLHRMFRRRISPNDWPTGTWFVHACWGEHDSAHVGKHRSKGAPDLRHVVNMCRALHDFYDQHRSKFAHAANLTERQLEFVAAGNALKYVERPIMVPCQLFEQVIAALAEARDLVHSYYREPGWAEYQQSPEMKRINGAMDAAYKMRRVEAMRVPTPHPEDVRDADVALNRLCPHGILKTLPCAECARSALPAPEPPVVLGGTMICHVCGFERSPGAALPAAHAPPDIKET